MCQYHEAHGLMLHDFLVRRTFLFFLAKLVPYEDPTARCFVDGETDIWICQDVYDIYIYIIYMCGMII